MTWLIRLINDFILSSVHTVYVALSSFSEDEVSMSAAVSKLKPSTDKLFASNLESRPIPPQHLVLARGGRSGRMRAPRFWQANHIIAVNV